MILFKNYLLYKYMNCKLFDENEKRLSFFPIKYPVIKEFLDQQRAVFWTPPEINLNVDILDWENKLNDDEKFFIEHILAFFSVADKLVNINIEERFMKHVTIYEVEANYNWQASMEDIHAETYSLLVDTIIKDEKKKDKLYDAIKNYDVIKEKAEWAIRCIDSDNLTFSERLFAFACVEGIFFSGSFCAIYWLKKRGLMPGLCFANELISRDEGMHTDFAVLVYHTFLKDTIYDGDNLTLTQEKAFKIIDEVVKIENKFITTAIPCKLIGMNDEMMCDYIKFVSDRLLTQFGFEKKYNIMCPFDWMDSISVRGKTNFFEKKVAEYQRVKNDDEEFDCEY